ADVETWPAAEVRIAIGWAGPRRLNTLRTDAEVEPVGRHLREEVGEIANGHIIAVPPLRHAQISPSTGRLGAVCASAKFLPVRVCIFWPPGTKRVQARSWRSLSPHFTQPMPESGLQAGTGRCARRAAAKQSRAAPRPRTSS